jgi:type I restriction enzyme R subunit
LPIGLLQWARVRLVRWLAHQFIGLKRADKEVFDSVIVVTDRRLIDNQIQTTIN